MILRFTALLLLLFPTIASADLQAAVGSFSTGTGAVSSTVSVSSLSFEPKTVIFFWNGRTESTDAVGSSSIRPGVCFAVSSSSQKNVSAFAADATGTTSAGTSKRDDSCVDVLLNASTYDGRASLTSMDAAGFTLTIQDQFATSYRIGYLALGGSDITNVATGHSTTGTSASKSFSGIGFQPDTILMLSHGGASTTTSGITSAGITLSFGAANGAIPVSATCAITSATGGTPSDTSRYCRTGDLYAAVDQAKTVRSRGSLDSFDEDGFTIALSTTTSSRYISWLAIKGAQFSIGDLLTQTDTVTDISETGFGFVPSAVLAVSHGTSASGAGTVQDHGEMSIGVAVSTSSRISVSIQDEDNLATTETSSAIEFDALYANISTADAIEGLMDYKSIDSDGFTFIMDDADPAQAYAWYLAIGPTTAGGGQAPRTMHQFRLRRM